MDCICGRYHSHAPPNLPAGKEIPLSRPLVALSGQLICKDEAQLMLALDLLTEHSALSRAEPGNLRFDIAQSDDPMVWNLQELYADDAAFQAHRARLRDSRWGRESHGIARDFARVDALPRIRVEDRRDHAQVHALLTRAFGGEDEARLVETLRADGDLSLSLVAELDGTIVGHIAFSPLAAAQPALALAPLAVHPAVQGRGIGTALMHAGLDVCGDHAVVVLGDPTYYQRFGFLAADLVSPYAGPHLMAWGPPLPAGSVISHAPAFCGPQAAPTSGGGGAS